MSRPNNTFSPFFSTAKKQEIKMVNRYFSVLVLRTWYRIYLTSYKKHIEGVSPEILEDAPSS